MLLFFHCCLGVDIAGVTGSIPVAPTIASPQVSALARFKTLTGRGGLDYGPARFDKGAWSSSGRTIPSPVAQVLRMKIKNSLRALRKRHRNNRVVRRRGRLYVINKTNRRFKARQG